MTDDHHEPELVLLREDDGSVSSVDLEAFDRRVTRTVALMQEAHGVDHARRLGRVGDELFQLSEETSPAYMRWWASDVASLTLRLLLMQAEPRAFLWIRINLAAFCFAFRLARPVEKDDANPTIRRGSDTASDSAGELLLSHAVATAEHLIDPNVGSKTSATELGPVTPTTTALSNYAVAVADLISRFVLHSAERDAIEPLLDRFTQFVTQYRDVLAAS